MKTITKYYSGAQDGYLYPREQEIGGVSGDSDACKIYFKIPKTYGNGWAKMIAFNGEIFDPITKEYVPMEYPLASDNSFTIPPEITDQYRGKTISYTLVLTEIATDTILQSQPAALYFSKSAKNTNITTFLATHAVVDVDFAIDKTHKVDRPVLRFFRPEGSPEIRLKMEVPYLENGLIPDHFISSSIRIDVYHIESVAEITGLVDARTGDWAIIDGGVREGDMYLLAADDPTDQANWRLIRTDFGVFKSIDTIDLVVQEDAVFQSVLKKVLITDEDGGLTGSTTTIEQLAQIDDLRLGEENKVQKQIDGKIERVDEAKETGGKACFVPFYATPKFNQENVVVTVDKIRLSRGKGESRVDSIDIPVPKAYVEGDNPITGTSTAGLYTKDLADKKFNILTLEETGGVPFSVPYGIDVSEGLPIGPEGIDLTLKTVWLDNRKNRVDTYHFPYDLAPVFDGNNLKIAGLYTKTAADKKLNKLPKPDDALAYHIPYHIIAKPTAEQIDITLKTITLDNNEEKIDFPFVIPGMDGTSAGLYTPNLAKLKLNVSDVINNVQSVASDKALSANMGRELNERIDSITIEGRFLSTWDCVTGMPGTDPPTGLPYIYKSGDYYLVDNISSEGKNLRPNGTQYDGTPSTVYQIGEVVVGQIYKFDGNDWILTSQTLKTVSFKNIAGWPRDNANLAAEFDKQIHLLGNEAGSGEPYHFTYFYDFEPQPDKIIASVDTITLDNNKTIKRYSKDIPAMDGVNAGLYTKALADLKVDKAYVDAELAKKITLLGNATPEGEPYHFPFNIREVVQNPEMIVVKFDTITLDNEKTHRIYDHNIPSADIENNKSGLYNKQLADAKVDKEIISSIGKAQIFNEADGGGAKFDFASGAKSYVGVNNEEDGIMAGVYALDKNNKGTRLMFTKDKIYYTAGQGDAKYEINDEIATIDDIYALSGSFVDNFPTRAALEEYPKEKLFKNDYAIVEKDETYYEARTRYRWTSVEWKFEYEIGDRDSIKLLGNEPSSGEPYHFTYYYDVKPKKNVITVGIETITLDNKRTRKHYEMDVPAMDAEHDTAGLYTKDMAEAKQNKLNTLFDVDKYFIPSYVLYQDKWHYLESLDLFMVDVIIDGVKENAASMISSVYIGTSEEAMEQRNAANHIIRAESYDGFVRFYADEPLEDNVYFNVTVI